MAHLDARTTVDATGTAVGVLWGMLDPTSASAWIVAIGCGSALVFQRLGSWWLDYTKRKNLVEVERLRDMAAVNRELEELTRESSSRRLAEAAETIAEEQAARAVLAERNSQLEHEVSEAHREASIANARHAELSNRIIKTVLGSLRDENYFSLVSGSDDECPTVPTP